MYKTTLSSRFQISIPKGIRESMGLKSGQRFSVIARGSIIELVPVVEIAQARGKLKGANTGDYRDRKDRV